MAIKVIIKATMVVKEVIPRKKGLYALIVVSLFI